MKDTSLAMLFLGVFLCHDLSAQLRLGSIFSDHMVLQRDREIKVWGWDTPGQVVETTFDQLSRRTKADNKGYWSLKFPKRQAGGPFSLRVKGSTILSLKDILIGDLWVCGGQSNMEWSFNQLQVYQSEILAKRNANVRLINIENAYSYAPQSELTHQALWKVAEPEVIAEFSALGYFFGEALQKSQQVPIGLISSNVGGTQADPWISLNGLDSLKNLRPNAPYADHQKKAFDILGDRVLTQDLYEELYQKYLLEKDRKSHKVPPQLLENLTPDWKDMGMATTYEDYSGQQHDGIVWFRKQVFVPSALAGKDLYLNLGLIDDIDSTWFNGVPIGGQGSRLSFRNYQVPGELVKPGMNSITIRVLDIGGKAGFLNPGEPMFAYPADFSIRMSLSSGWRVRPGASAEEIIPLLGSTRPLVHLATLFNAMIAPLTQVPVKGVIWYQGESNRGQPGTYRKNMNVLINDWRTWWKLPDLPFLTVQIASFGPPQLHPGGSNLALLREAQALTSRELTNVGLAVTIDVGDAYDIHPKRKREVAERLARIALNQVYGVDIEYQGPTLSSYEIKGNEIHVSFAHTLGELRTPDSSLLVQEFSIAGEDRVFHRAQGVIEGDKVIVSSKSVPRPVAVRYAWADNPAAVNLYNREGLPAVPFRTDNWSAHE